MLGVKNSFAKHWFFMHATDDQVFMHATDDQVFMHATDDQVFMHATDDQVFMRQMLLSNLVSSRKDRP